ncbi:Glutamate--tRNA ligase, mitochondrial [Golovinomyces cichoracearum]|uniref:Glutamate--tRNA ligase, mitochondrial n=1 Tax=Golovinomyces cichoracearum TaxID=62708 RepID=A0A420IE47_9PEZI|nr:Glutamate--tRNA ligase, mitochondrial [Golovinomyces cichoracearum]
MMKLSFYDFGSKRLNYSRVFSKFYSNISCNSAPGKDYALCERGPARTRFAPSPTGYIHLGSLRTALFNFLVAKATGGQFILRIEDTDKKRTVPDAIQRIYEDLDWAGIKWDEGPDLGGPFGPYQQVSSTSRLFFHDLIPIQSKRLTIYAEHANQLLESGNAYRCFCSPSRLESLALYQTQQGLAKAYDRYCTSNSKRDSHIRSANGEAHTIRLKAPSKYPPFRDTVYGFVKQREKPQSLQSFDDPILIKSDGFPTYHFANVVDDHLMQITNVIRGAEWMSSTHMHLALYQAFGWDPPTFSHVGLLLNKSKQKLSKRNGSQYIADFRSEGIFPETLTNFAALLGWSHREKSDTMSMKDLIKNASMKFTKGDSIVCYDKLNFLQRRHAARYASLPPSDQPLHSLYHLAVVPIYRELEYRSKLEDLTTYSKIPPGESRRNFIQQVLQADSSNYTNPKEFIDRNIYFFVAPSKKTLSQNMSSKIKIYESHDSNEVDIETLLILFRTINEIDLDEWEIEILRKRVNWIIEQRTEIITGSEIEKVGISSDLKSRKETLKSWSKFVHEYLRWALCAGKSGPDGITILFLLGKENVSERLRRAETLVRSRAVELVEMGSNQPFPEIK